MSSLYKPRVLKEGLVEKKSTVLKKWRRRYFKLNGDVLCFFRREDQTNTTRPMGRIFLADVLAVGKYFSKAKGKDNCFSIDTKSGKTHVMNCTSTEEREAWISIVNFAKDDFFKEEQTDPVRRRSIKLKGDFKRVKLFKDPTKGIGVRIKSVNGCVFVTRIVEDGPVAETGVLRPGDQIIDIDGVNVGNMSIEEVSEILKAAPILTTCTVKPANHYRYCKDENEPQNKKYAEIDIPTTNQAASVASDHEDDQSTDDSNSYISPIPSDDEVHTGESGDHLYENAKQIEIHRDGKSKDSDDDNSDDESDQKYYVNMPDKVEVPEKPKRQKEVPHMQPRANYLELCFEDS